MASMKYCDKHNQVVFLNKPEESVGFTEIVDFLKGSHIRYALTHNPTIHDSLVKKFWQTAIASTLTDGTLELRATIDTLEYTITKASIRSKLQLADASGISMLPNTEIFKGMGNMGYPTDGQADQAGIKSQPSSATVPPPPTSQPAPTESTTIPPTPVTEPTSKSSSLSTAPEHETIEHPFEQPSPEHQPSSPRQESDIPKTQAPTHTHEAETGHMSIDDLFQLVPQLMTNIESLEKDLKQTNPQGLEAAETLAEVLSQIKTKRRNVKTGVRRRLDVEDVSTGFEGFEDVSTGFTDIKSASENISSCGEHASLAEIARIQAEEEAENARREDLKRQDELAAKRLQEELELSEAQKKRMAQIAGEDVSEADYAQRMGGWKLAQIKKLTDEELKEKFEYLMRSMEREDVSVPKEKDKESVKREEEFEIKKPVLRYTKRKSLARKGLQKKPEFAKSGTEEDVEAYMEERVDEPSSKEFPMSSIPQGPVPAKIVKWQIIKTGKRGAYHIIREDNTDVVYVNFQGLLNDLTRDDLKELYRLMMLMYRDNRPEEEFERVLWGI
ncbi:hypothetical protein Tco_0882854 [Tanacetum coccineum]